MPIVTVDVADLRPGLSRMVEVGGRALLVCRSETGVHAADAVCPHQAKSLEGARVRGDALMCPHHGARFSLIDGASKSYALTARSLAVYPAHLDGGILTVTLPD